MEARFQIFLILLAVLAGTALLAKRSNTAPAILLLLGAIVARPDVVAPLAIARKLGLPRRILTVLEGEGLANDATALILYRFAVAAISTGLFSLPQAAGAFCAIVVGELLFGVAVGWL